MRGFATLSLAVATIVGLANAAVIEVAKRSTALEVTLSAADNAAVKATIKNVGSEDLNLLNIGTILDSKPVNKLSVMANGEAVAFDGILLSVHRDSLTAEDFTCLAAGASIEKTINAATIHDLSVGGDMKFTAKGSIPFAIGSATEISSSVSFSSNTVSMSVDGAAAAAVRSNFYLNKRTHLQSDCTGSSGTATKSALSNCVSLARSASSAALSGSASKFSEYFKTTSSSTRSTVAARFSAVANECSTTTSGATSYYCTDVYSDCSRGVLAYTIPSRNVVVNCPLYFTALPNLTKSCHAQDQTTTTIHEFTHAPGVYSPGTQDNGYGYSAATALSASQALNNADTYALYANAIYVGC